MQEECVCVLSEPQQVRRLSNMSVQSRKRQRTPLPPSASDEGPESCSSDVSTREERKDREEGQEDQEETLLRREQDESKAKREAARKYLESLRRTPQLQGRLTTDIKGEEQEAKKHMVGRPDTGPDQDVREGDETDMDDLDAAQVDAENIKSRLIQDILQAKGKVFRHIAHEYEDVTTAALTLTEKRETGEAEEEEKNTIQGDSTMAKFVAFKSLQTGSGHHTPTCVVFSADGRDLFAGYKSGDIIQWSVPEGHLLRTFSHAPRTKSRGGKGRGRKGSRRNVDGHQGHVLALALSPNGRYLVSGGSDHLIIVWSLLTPPPPPPPPMQDWETAQDAGESGADDQSDSENDGDKSEEDDKVQNDSDPMVQTILEGGNREKGIATVFTAHRGPVTALAFQVGAMTLFSASADRTVKVWNIDQLAYVDTLFGHQDEVLGLDALATERCLTVGARDRTARLWKVAEETQLVFRASEETGGSLDCIGAIDQDHFVTASEAGALSLWACHRKKPLATQLKAHAGPVATLHVVRLTDLVISGGASDGLVRLWAMDAEGGYKGMRLVQSIDLGGGSVNGVSLSGDGRTLAVALGRDQRLGRWINHRGVKNRIVLLRQLKDISQ